MKHILTSLFLIGLLGGVSQLTFGQQMTAKQIMEKADQQLQANDETVAVDFTLVNKRGKETRRKFELFSKQMSPTEERRFLRFLEPGDIKGTLLLTYDYSNKEDDIWLFLPALGKSRRISAGNKTDSFVGSDFTYEDIENVDLINTDFKLLRNETYEGEPCYVIEGMPANENEKKESGYSKRTFWITEKNFLPRKTEHFNKKGQLAKVLKMDDARQISGTEKYRLFRWEMADQLNGSKTIFAYTQLTLNTGVPDETFSQKNLK